MHIFLVNRYFCEWMIHLYRNTTLLKRKMEICLYAKLLRETDIIWAALSEKVHSSMCEIRGFASSCACARSHPGICSPVIRFCSTISNDYDSWQRRPWSDCAFAQSDLSLRRPRMPRRHVFAWRSAYMNEYAISV